MFYTHTHTHLDQYYSKPLSSWLLFFFKGNCIFLLLTQFCLRQRHLMTSWYRVHFLFFFLKMEYWCSFPLWFQNPSGLHLGAYRSIKNQWAEKEGGDANVNSYWLRNGKWLKYSPGIYLSLAVGRWDWPCLVFPLTLYDRLQVFIVA